MKRKKKLLHQPKFCLLFVPTQNRMMSNSISSALGSIIFPTNYQPKK